MEQAFRVAYRQLNARQKQAVDTIDGPVLVIAGPGTGKTQLLSVRVANILKTTDIAPSNILCLTLTDNAARNMRERLETIIGQAAYHVSINTFHSFGAEIINQFPDYFAASSLLQPVDELGQYEILRAIFQELPHANPLSVKVGDEYVHLKGTLQTISWLKQNALLPHELHEIISANQQFMDAAADDLAEAFTETPAPKHLAKYKHLLTSLRKHDRGRRLYGFPSYGSEAANELEQAIAATSETGRYAPKITAWRSKWTQKNAAGRQVFKDAGQALRKMHALANVYQTLRERMAAQGLFDFDDMIIEVVQALEANDELRLSLQERCQYILVDEFQDTNKAQLRILEALGNNPINEQRPNIMAVGDDDQAIYAFQGAEVSNMVAFARLYRQPAIITLADNYRSTAAILEASFAVAGQITDRLESVIPDTHKELKAHAIYRSMALEHPVFPSELAQYDWIAAQIQDIIKKGSRPEEIAVVAPRHRYLERLMPYLGKRHIPVAYERRENILESPIIRQLLTMAELVIALSDNRQADIDRLFSQVLAYNFWELPAELLLSLNLECYNSNRHWLDVLADSKSPRLKAITHWFIELARSSELEPLEYVLDKLLGSLHDGVDNQYDDLLLPKAPAAAFVSPMRAYYFNHKRYETATDAYLTLLGQLSTLRQKIRQWKPNVTIYIRDLIEFANLHLQANLVIVDTNPHTQTTNAVQVMTAYKAKGLEFGSVFVINAQDEVWGPTARQRRSTVGLPKNLPLQPASDGDNDKLRLLFVAMTRAKHSLYITGYLHDQDNKLSPGLSFIGGHESAPVHPSLAPSLLDRPETTAAIEILATDWVYRFRQIIADKPTLFEPILANYKLSVTHLNNFIDIKDGGPEYFLMHNLLHFPAAATPSAAYGDAVHKTIQWAYAEMRQTGRLPAPEGVQAHFSDLLARKHLRPADFRRLDARGQRSLAIYLQARSASMQPQDIIERGFNNEGAVVDGVQLSGKIDKLCFPNAGEIKVIDFKTGKPARSWQGRDEFEKIKLHKYRQQLLFYKLLVEHSASFGRKNIVTGGALEFIEPEEDERLLDNLELTYDADELKRFISLTKAVWQHITSLNFPGTSAYEANLRGIQQFEQDLIDGKV